MLNFTTFQTPPGNRIRAKINLVINLVLAVAAIGSAFYAYRANTLAVEANRLSAEANSNSKEANQIAVESNLIAQESNRLAQEANTITIQNSLPDIRVKPTWGTKIFSYIFPCFDDSIQSYRRQLRADIGLEITNIGQKTAVLRDFEIFDQRSKSEWVRFVAKDKVGNLTSFPLYIQPNQSIEWIFGGYLDLDGNWKTGDEVSGQDIPEQFLNSDYQTKWVLYFEEIGSVMITSKILPTTDSRFPVDVGCHY